MLFVVVWWLMGKTSIPAMTGPKLRCGRGFFFTEKDDGLSLPWRGTVFLNPPYGRELPVWISKARSEVGSENAKTAVALIRPGPIPLGGTMT